MFEPFQQLVYKAANRFGVGTEVKAAKVCQDFRSLVPILFKGKETPEEYIKPAYFKNSILVINVENPGWSQEVAIRKHKIIKEMNEKAGSEIVKNLRTQLSRKNP